MYLYYLFACGLKKAKICIVLYRLIKKKVLLNPLCVLILCWACFIPVCDGPWSKLHGWKNKSDISLFWMQVTWALISVFRSSGTRYVIVLFVLPSTNSPCDLFWLFCNPFTNPPPPLVLVCHHFVRCTVSQGLCSLIIKSKLTVLLIFFF